jgi:hypothetical protein
MEPPGSEKRPLDVLAVEETLVDFISHEFPISLRTVGKFIRYLCGQPANVAVYVAKLGGRSAMISKVGTDHFGECLEEQLARHGVSAEGLEGLSRTGDAATTNVFVTRIVGVPDFQVNRGTNVLLSIRAVTDELVERARIVHASAPRPSPSRVTRSGWRPGRPCDWGSGSANWSPSTRTTTRWSGRIGKWRGRSSQRSSFTSGS